MSKTTTATGLSLIAVYVFTSACAALPNLAASAGKPSVSNSGYDAQLTTPAHPLPLSVTPDESAAVSEVFDYGGGTLSATGADGTTYTLEIPEGALYAPTKIRMTPLAAVEGLPFGEGAPHAVLLEPDGLRLSDVAILTITPPTTIPVDQQIFFGMQGKAHEFGFAAPVIDSTALEIMITHFSGYGVEKGLLADPEKLRERLGGDVERRLEDIVAQELARIRQEILMNGDSPETTREFSDLIAWARKVYYEQVLKPRIEAAGESCAAGRLAVETYMSFERQLALLGGGQESQPAELAGLMVKVSNLCLQEEYELCRDQHIIHRITSVVLSMERQAVLLGLQDSDSLDAKGEDLARRCLSFELDLNSQIVGDPPQGWHTESDMTSKVELSFPGIGVMISQQQSHTGDGISGEAPLVNERFLARSNTAGCEVISSSRGGSTLHISNLAWVVDFRGEDDELGYIKDLSMVITPDPTTESYRGRCGTSIFNADNSNAWSSAWGALHQAACMPPSASGASGDVPETGLLSPEMISRIEAFGKQNGLDEGEIQDLIDAASSGDLPPGALDSMLGASASPSDPSAAPEYALGACQTETGWDVPAGEIFGIKEVHLSLPQLGMSENGTYVLRHDPK